VAALLLCLEGPAVVSARHDINAQIWPNCDGGTNP
jgi:hypothetical protein